MPQKNVILEWLPKWRWVLLQDCFVLISNATTNETIRSARNYCVDII
jgi:hypothetical protein